MLQCDPQEKLKKEERNSGIGEFYCSATFRSIGNSHGIGKEDHGRHGGFVSGAYTPAGRAGGRNLRYLMNATACNLLRHAGKFLRAPDETKMSVQRRKSSRPPVRRRSSAYDRYLTDIRDMICARCGGTRIPNKNINCTCQGSKGKGEEARTYTENQLDSVWKQRLGPRVRVCIGVCVLATYMCMHTLSPGII